MLYAAAAQRAAVGWLFKTSTMLPKNHRLSKKEFALVINTSTGIHSLFFVLKHIPAPVFKFSPTAPKKIFKTAVSRNRTRRRIYAAVHEIARAKKVKPNLIALVVKKDIKDMDSQRLIRILQDLFVQAGLIK